MTSDQCILCRHYEGGQVCKAFDRIPQVIFTGEHDHREPYPGDHGIQFEPLSERDGHYSTEADNTQRSSPNGRSHAV